MALDGLCGFVGQGKLNIVYGPPVMAVFSCKEGEMEKVKLTVNVKPETRDFLKREALDKGTNVSRLIDTIVEIIVAGKKRR